MHIKDFQVGQTAYMLSGENRCRTAPPAPLKEVTVLKVGHKYVTVAEPQMVEHPWSHIQFESTPEGFLYLTEKRDWGYARSLFATQEAYLDHRDRELLWQWIRNAVDRQRFYDYSVDQLRAVKQILDPESEEDNGGD